MAEHNNREVNPDEKEVESFPPIKDLFFTLLLLGATDPDVFDLLMKWGEQKNDNA